MELAQRLGYTSTGTISRIERDGSGMDKAKIVEAAKVLHVHPYVLSSEETLTGDQLILLNKFMSLMLSKDTDNFKEIAQSILSK